MTTKETIIVLAIHALVPLIGLVWFLWLYERMKSLEVPNRPTIALFLIFTNYGGLLLVALTTLFWQWSGMASLWVFYLVLGAPIVMGIITYQLRHISSLSKYHYATFISSLLYFPIALATFLLLFNV